jgi:hypothetical protein
MGSQEGSSHHREGNNPGRGRWRATFVRCDEGFINVMWKAMNEET